MMEVLNAMTFTNIFGLIGVAVAIYLLIQAIAAGTLAVVRFHVIAMQDKYDTSVNLVPNILMASAALFYLFCYLFVF